MVAAEKEVGGGYDGGGIWSGEFERNVWQQGEELWVRTSQASDIEEGCQSAGSYGNGGVIGAGVVLSATADGDVGE